MGAGCQSIGCATRLGSGIAVSVAIFVRLILLYGR